MTLPEPLPLASDAPRGPSGAESAQRETVTPVSAETALDAASVLTEHLPTVARLTTRPTDAASAALPDAIVRSAVVATFVGSASFDLALAIRPELLPTAGHENEALLVDLVQTALTDAAARFGDGVLAWVRVDDATALFADAAATVVELRDGEESAGLFGVRPRASAARAEADDVAGRLSRISGVEMDLTVQIGRTRMSVRDVLALEPGAIVELDRSAGSPADILLNGRLIARGEVVVVDQDYAVRITSIVDGADTSGD